MIEKISNLEKYYLELQEEAMEDRRVLFTPFNQLPQWEIDEFECSEGFRRFLIRGAWTKGLKILVLYVIIPLAVIFGAYLKNS